MAYHCVKHPSRECDGCMDCEPDIHYYCPICNMEAYETVFVNSDGEVIGCDNCVEIKEPHEVIDDETD